MRHWWLWVVAIAGCKNTEPKPPPAVPVSEVVAAPAHGRPVGKGQVKRAPLPLMVAVIAPSGADLTALEKLARERAASAKLDIEVVRARPAELGVNRDSAEWTPGGLPASEYDGIESGTALVLGTTQAAGFEAFRALATVASAVATTARGWVFDPGIGGLFAADAFATRIPGPTPDVRTLIVIHAVSGDGTEPTLDTMGMVRLGLPELYLPAAAPRQLDALNAMMNAAAQTLLVRGDVSRMGQLDVDLATLGATWHADDVKKGGGSGRITWRVQWTKLDGHADEDALHVELVPPKGVGPAGVTEAIVAWYGATPDPVAHLAADDPELLAAGKRARAELDGMRMYFATGVPPGEELAVKAPFTAPDGQVEWMWVDVIKWQGGELTGLLSNEPNFVTSVRYGSRVTVKLSEVADYVHVQPDGRQRGGYSVEVMRKRGLIP